MRQEPELKQNLAGVVQILQHTPENYRAFGPYWWSLKRFIRRHYPGMFYWAAGRVDDEQAREAVESELPDEQKILAAACDHYARMVLQGTPTIGSGNLPDGSPYQLDDPDMGPANFLT